MFSITERPVINLNFNDIYASASFNYPLICSLAVHGRYDDISQVFIW